jgi:hypothetical protein
MARRLLAALFVTATAFVLVARADDKGLPIPPVKAAGSSATGPKDEIDPKAKIDNAPNEQDRMKRQFEEFKLSLLRLAHRLENSSREEDKQKANVLKDALAKANELGIEHKMTGLINALKSADTFKDTDKLSDTIGKNDDLRKDLNLLIEMLQRDNKDEELRRKREELTRLLEQLKELIAREERIRARNDLGRQKPSDIAPDQRKTNDDMRKTAGETPKPQEFPKSEGKLPPKSESKDGGAGEPKNDAKDPKGDDRPKEGKPTTDSKETKPGDSKEGKPTDGKETKPSDQKDGKGGDSKENKPGDNKDGKGGDSKEGKPGDQKDGKGGDSKEGKPGDSKSGDSKDGKPGDGKPAESKVGDSKDGKGGDSKEGKPADQKSGDSKEGKPGEGKPGDSKDGKPGEGKPGSSQPTNPKPTDPKAGQPGEGKPNAGKPGDPKPGEGKPGDAKPGEGKPGDAKPGEGKPSDNKAKGDNKGSGKPGEGKPGDAKPGEGKPSSSSGQPSQSQPGEGKPSPVPSPGTLPGKTPPTPPMPEADPARKKIKDAAESGDKAANELEKNKADKAGPNIDDTIDKLKQAQKKLEELLKSIREEETERILAALKARCEKMLAMQIAVRDGTVNLEKLVKAHDSQKPDEVDIHKSNELADKEAEIVKEANGAIRIIEAEGSAVAFAEVFKQVREDMIIVQNRLNKADTGVVTVQTENDIIDTLKDMVDALTKAIKQAKAQPPQPPKPPGKPPRPGLIDEIAELKMIRAMQEKVNKRTELYGKQYPGEQANVPVGTNVDPKVREHIEMIQHELQDLGKRQEKIHKITDDIAKGKNKNND